MILLQLAVYATRGPTTAQFTTRAQNFVAHTQGPRRGAPDQVEAPQFLSPDQFGRYNMRVELHDDRYLPLLDRLMERAHHDVGRGIFKSYEACRAIFDRSVPVETQITRLYLDQLRVVVSARSISFKDLFILYVNYLPEALWNDEGIRINDIAVGMEHAQNPLNKCPRGTSAYIIDTLLNIFPDPHDQIKHEFIESFRDLAGILDRETLGEYADAHVEFFIEDYRLLDGPMSGIECEAMLKRVFEKIRQDAAARNPVLRAVTWETIKEKFRLDRDFFERIAHVADDEEQARVRDRFDRLAISWRDAASVTMELYLQAMREHDPDPHEALKKQTRIIAWPFYQRFRMLKQKFRILEISPREARAQIRQWLADPVINPGGALQGIFDNDRDGAGNLVWPEPADAAPLAITASVGNIWSLRFGKGRDARGRVAFSDGADNLPEGDVISMMQIIEYYKKTNRTKDEIRALLNAIVRDGAEACGTGKIVRGMFAMVLLPEFMYNSFAEYEAALPRVR